MVSLVILILEKERSKAIRESQVEFIPEKATSKMIQVSQVWIHREN
jgi:hypothetical protein